MLALYFAEERLFVDSGYYFFHTVNSSFFHIELQRYILVFPELFPLLGVWLGLPLKILIGLFSVGHVLFSTSIFMYCSFKLKQNWTLIPLLGIQVLLVFHGYFVPAFELYYGAALLVLLLACLIAGNDALWFLILLLFFILFSHPNAYLLVIGAGFLFFGEGIKRKWLFSFLAVFVLMLLVKYFNAAEYEQAKAAVFKSRLISGEWVNVLSLNYLKESFTAYLEYFILIAILAFTAIISALLKRKLKRVAYVIFGSIFFWLLANVGLMGFEHSRYYEQAFVLLNIFLLLAFALELKEISGKTRLAFLVLFFLALIWRGNEILDESIHFSQRIEKMKKYCSENPDHAKLILPPYVGMNGLDWNWSLPLESLIISSENGFRNTQSCISQEDYYFNGNNSRHDETKFILRKWEVETAFDFLNEKYFYLPNGSYQLIAPSE